jgi:CubicO group peptidase (beta-lactamase class C family)
LIRNGDANRSGAVGFADPRTRRALRADTPMRVASISKIATTLVVMKLVEERRLSLDADIADILGPWARNPAFAEPIRVRGLLSHTSSMRDGEVYWAGIGERIADFFTPGAAHWEGGAHWDRAQGPGRFFTYCNLGFGILATVVERITGERFDLVAHETLLGPLGLEAGFNWSESDREFIARGSPVWRRGDAGWEAQADDPLPAGAVYLNPDNRPLADYHPGENGALFSPQGGLRASAEDLAELGLVLIRGGAPAFRSPVVDRMLASPWRFDGANGETGNGLWRAYGLGLQIIEPGASSPIENQRRALVGHSGDAYGLRGGLWLDLTAKNGFVFLFNGGPQDENRKRGARSAFSRPEEVAMQLLHDAAMAP